MSMNRRTILGAAAALTFVFAHAAHAMPNPDDNMDSWPQKLKEVANPYAVERLTVPGRPELKALKPFRVNPDPTPWQVQPNGAQIQR